MKIKHFFLLVVIGALLTASFGMAQQKSLIKPFDLSAVLRSLTTNSAGQFSLLGVNPDNFQMQHSYEMSVFSSGGQSLSQAIYLNTIKYKISEPLSLTFQWGVQHQPFGNMGNSNFSTRGAFVSGAQLKYQPNDKFMLKISYNSYPNGVNPYYNRYYYNRLGFNSFRSNSFWSEDEE